MMKKISLEKDIVEFIELYNKYSWLSGINKRY